MSRASLQDWPQYLLPFTAVQEQAGWAHLLFSSMTHLVLGWMHRDRHEKAQGCLAAAIYPQCDHSHLTHAQALETDLDTMQLEEQLRRRLDAARESIRSKYKALQSAARPHDPIRKYLADEIEKELKSLRGSLSHDEIVQVQARIDAVRPHAGPMCPSVVDPHSPTLFAELQDEYHFLQRLLE